MNVKDYQLLTRWEGPDAAAKQGSLQAISYCSLQLADASIEVCKAVQPLLKLNHVPSEVILAPARRRMAEALWYLTRLADQLGIPLEVLMAESVQIPELSPGTLGSLMEGTDP